MSFAGGGTVDGIVFAAPRQSSSGVSFQNELGVVQLEVNTPTFALKSYGNLNATGELSAARIKMLNTRTILTGSSTVLAAVYLGGIIKYNIGGNVNQTVDSAANIILLVGTIVGTTFSCIVYQNNTNRSISVSAGSGVTVYDGRNSNALNTFTMTFIVSSSTTIDLLLN